MDLIFLQLQIIIVLIQITCDTSESAEVYIDQWIQIRADIVKKSPKALHESSVTYV